MLIDEKLTDLIIGKAMVVHSALGPGLLESVYETCLAYELTQAELNVERQKNIAVRYKGVILDDGLRMDMVVAGKVIIELKCVEKILPVHEAQLYTYLKLSGLKVVLLFNFYTRHLRDGIKRIVM